MNLFLIHLFLNHSKLEKERLCNLICAACLYAKSECEKESNFCTLQKNELIKTTKRVLLSIFLMF